MFAEFDAYLVNEVSHEAHVGTGAHAQRTYAAVTVHRARVDVTDALIDQPDGRKQRASHIVFVEPVATDGATTLTTIGLLDRVTLPDGSQPRVLRVEPGQLPDSDEIHHFEVICG